MPTVRLLMPANHRALPEELRKGPQQPARSTLRWTKHLSLGVTITTMNLRSATPWLQRLDQPPCFSDPTISLVIQTATSIRDKSTTLTRGILMTHYVRQSMSKTCIHCFVSEKRRRRFVQYTWKINLTLTKGCAPSLLIGSSKCI